MKCLRLYCLCVLLCLTACQKESVRSNKPLKESNFVSQLTKSDIDHVLDVHIKVSQDLLRELMLKLYKRNPRELKKSNATTAAAQVKRLFEQTHEWDFPDLQGKHDIELIKLTFQPTFQGDRVFVFVAGLMSMVMKSYNYQSDFHLLAAVDSQKLYNCARNIEIAVWKLSNNVDADGEPLLYSNASVDEAVTNLSYERLLGKLIATQDNIAMIMAEKQNRKLKTFIQTASKAAFFII